MYRQTLGFCPNVVLTAILFKSYTSDFLQFSPGKWAPPFSIVSVIQPHVSVGPVGHHLNEMTACSETGLWFGPLALHWGIRQCIVHFFDKKNIFFLQGHSVCGTGHSFLQCLDCIRGEALAIVLGCNDHKPTNWGHHGTHLTDKTQYFSKMN